MKWDILDSFYNNATGITYLKVHTKYGNFQAQASCNADDWDIMNRWDGFKFCEYKIQLQILNAKYKVLQERVNGMRQMLDYCRIAQFASWTDETWTLVDGLERQMRIAQYIADKVKKEYENKKEKYPEFCELMLDLRRAARNKNFDEEPTEE